MAELKPCPFCGGEAEYAHLRKRYNRHWGVYCPSYIRCKVCGATSQVKVSTENAREAWNRRYKEPQEIDFDYEAED